MSEKISQYSVSVSALATGDLMDVSKLISTSPDVYQSQKLNYSVLLSELNNDLSFVDGTGTTNYSARFSASGTIADGIIQDNGTTSGIGSLDAAVSFNLDTSLQVGQRVTQSKTNGNSEGIEGINYASNSGRNVGVAGYGGNASTESIGVRGVYKTTSANNDNTSSYIANGDGAGGFFQAARTGAGTIYGIIATTNLLTPDAAVTGVAGYFKAAGGGSNYAIQLVDGTEGAGKYLQSDASGRASWVTLTPSNVATDDMVIDDNTRYIRLKAGYTTNQYFQIQNTGGENFIKWLGDGTTQTRGQFFFNAAANGGEELYVIRAKSQGGFMKFRVQAEDNQGVVDIWGNQVYQLISLNSTSTSYFYNSLALGSATASARLDVKGAGSTSATTTALFQNSSSATSLEILDSGAISMYNSGGYKVFNINTAGGGVFGGNYTGAIGANPNNVIGGSYLNGVILGGYNNTHNGYLGICGGGQGNTITTDKEQSIAIGNGNTVSANYAVAISSYSTVSANYAATIGGYQLTASGEGAVAIGGWLAIASGLRSLASGFGAYAQGEYSVSLGSYCTSSARSARAIGEYCVASGVSSFVSGLGTNYGGTRQELKASGQVSFNHSYNDGTILDLDAEGNYSVILGGKNHWVKSGAHSSVILGGNTHVVNTNILRSVIIGGSSITADTNDTVYVPLLAIKSPIVPTATADTAGSTGSYSFDDNYMYVKTSAGWKRAALSTF